MYSYRIATEMTLEIEEIESVTGMTTGSENVTGIETGTIEEVGMQTVFSVRPSDEMFPPCR